MHGVYIPYWTFDAHVRADWTADAGYYYYVTESYTDSKGQSQTRQVQKTRWEPATGALDHFFDDELVAASRGVAETVAEDRALSDHGPICSLRPGFLSGWVVEQYQIDLGRARPACARPHGRGDATCAQQVPGDTQRNLSHPGLHRADLQAHPRPDLAHHVHPRRPRSD